MFKAIGQFFTTLFTLFSALDKGAKSLDHLASIAEAESEGLAEQMSIERKARLSELNQRLKVA
ncbi:MAG: hypothetical protein H6985_03080 [Pseudomonadales bacterium]|nr:hypothetical protein [Pseudomonadales bacterium]